MQTNHDNMSKDVAIAQSIEHFIENLNETNMKYCTITLDNIEYPVMVIMDGHNMTFSVVLDEEPQTLKVSVSLQIKAAIEWALHKCCHGDHVGDDKLVETVGHAAGMEIYELVKGEVPIDYRDGVDPQEVLAFYDSKPDGYRHWYVT